MTTVVYPIVVAWTWSGTGWLNKVGAGYMDFAGSGVVPVAQLHCCFEALLVHVTHALVDVP